MANYTLFGPAHIEWKRIRHRRMSYGYQKQKKIINY